MKTINFILGLATAVILAALISLGISAFYPSPTPPSFPSPAISAPCAEGDVTCQAQLQAQQQADQAQYTAAENAYESASQVYGRNLFVIANIIGLIVFAVGFWLVFVSAIAARGVPIGMMIAGLWSILYGYARGWGSVNDQLKFFIGLVIAILVIGGSMWLMQKRAMNLPTSSS